MYDLVAALEEWNKLHSIRLSVGAVYYSCYAESLLPPRNGICGYCTYDRKIPEALYIKLSHLLEQQSSLIRFAIYGDLKGGGGMCTKTRT